MVVLPDVLEPDLDVVFVGTAASERSGRDQAYYAHPSNQFWEVLYETGMTDELLEPDEYEKLREYSIGLTNLNKPASQSSEATTKDEFYVSGFRYKINHHQPSNLAFNGKTPAKAVFDANDIDYGHWTTESDRTDLHVLPSTAGTAKRWWDESYWQRLADSL